MTWTLTLVNEVDEPVDASPIDVARFDDMDATKRTPLRVGGRTVMLGELFDVANDTDSDDAKGLDRMVLRGDLTHFHHLGSRHRGGELWINGDVGDHLGGAIGASRIGMGGGRIVVDGSAGHYVGHRMRRGEIWIAGDIGDFAAASMVAGTIVAAGQFGDGLATAMRRGTVVTESISGLPSDRFSAANPADFLISRLIHPPNVAVLQRFWQSISSGRVCTRRGDRAVDGQGELVAAASV